MTYQPPKYLRFSVEVIARNLGITPNRVAQLAGEGKLVVVRDSKRVLPNATTIKELQQWELPKYVPKYELLPAAAVDRDDEEPDW